MRKRQEPAEVFHPGVFIVDELRARGMSIGRLAVDYGIDKTYLFEITKGERGLTQVIAEKLARWSGTSETYWLDLQLAYDLGKPKT